MKQLRFDKFPPLDYPCTEALNTLCTNLSFAGSGVKRIMVTSCEPNEGKSFIAMNLMRTFASMGKSVVMVDADLRRSAIEGHYGMRGTGEKLGLAHYLAGHCDIGDVIYQTTIPGACFIPIGKDVANSISLVSTELLGLLLNTLANEFDVVVIDTPPVGVIIDAAVIAKQCDGVLFVVSSGQNSRRALNDARQQMQKTGTPILGAILNNVSLNSRISTGKYYNKYYSHYNSYHTQPAPKPQTRIAVKQAGDVVSRRER